MKTTTKEIIWFGILCGATLFFLFFATGCKPKQIIQEKTVYKTDSTAVISLKSELQKKVIESELLKTDLERTRDENTRLQEEVSKQEIEYDTSYPVIPETGKPPVKKETTTISRSLLENTIKEFEIQKEEYRRELEGLTNKNSNLELTISALREENRDLTEKITPTTGFNFRLFFTGVGLGFLLSVVIWLLLKFR